MARRLAVLAFAFLLACEAPAATVPQARPSADPFTTPAPAQPSASFGVIALTRDGFAVRSEVDPTPIRVVPDVDYRLPGGPAVSNDGRYVAYWRPTSGGGDDLMLYDAATNTDPRALITLDSSIGGAIAWADDDSGLAFASRPSPPALPMALSVISLSDRSVRQIATSSSASLLLMPLTWIHETKSVSAVEHTPEGVVTSYVIASESGATSRFAVGNSDQVVRLGGVAVDPQSRILTYLVTFTCQDGTPGCSLVRFWTLEDPQQARWEAQIGPDRAYERVWWRPFSRSALVTVRGNEPAVQTMCVTKCGGRMIVDPPRQVLIRPDGSALLGASFNGRWTGTLYPLNGTIDRGIDLTTTGGGAPTLSVTLDAGLANRIHVATRITPLLTHAEILASVKASKTLATLDQGTFPFAGKVPTWTVAAFGQFEVTTRGGIIGGGTITYPCVVWTFNARLGTLMDQRYIPDAGACPVH